MGAIMSAFSIFGNDMVREVMVNSGRSVSLQQDCAQIIEVHDHFVTIQVLK